MSFAGHGDVNTNYHAFDYTKLTAINTCPRWGIIRYGHHKVMQKGGSAQALEAGKVAHECFSVIRLVQLGHPLAQGMTELMALHGQRLFGAGRWAQIAAGWNADDTVISMRQMCEECLASSSYVEDPFDKRRTVANIETALLYYIQRWDCARYPVWIRDSADPTSDVGIEIPFALRMDVQKEDGSDYTFYYTGRVDGIHVDRSGELVIHENKTASRLNDAWRLSFETSHQPTGYAVAASLFSGALVERGLVYGLSVPLPVRDVSSGYAVEIIRRDDTKKAEWMRWVEHTVEMHNLYFDRPLDAPMYTHSCNRYFRPCSYIPLCAVPPEEQVLTYSEMEKDEWSPLVEDKAGD